MKTYQKVVIGILGAGTLFSAGFVVRADTASWSQTVVSNAQTQIDATTAQETQNLLGDVNGKIAQQMTAQFSGMISDKQAYLRAFIEQYYNTKLSSLKDTPEYAQVSSQINSMTDAAIAQLKQQIDAAIAGH